jgi:hypothetical protein
MPWPYRDDGAVLVGKSRDGAIRPGPEQDDVAALQLEETPDIRRVFRAPRAFPRHAPVQAELTAPTDGAHSPYIGHRYPFPVCCKPLSMVMKVRLIIRSPRRRAAGTIRELLGKPQAVSGLD